MSLGAPPGRASTRTRLARVGVALAVVAGGCDSDATPTTTTVGLANPASVFCEEQGGQVEIVEDADGQRGICVLPDGRRIDEWEYYRSEHPTTTGD